MIEPFASGKDWTLYHGDCLKILPELSGIDAVVTDPPYGVELKEQVTKHRRTRSEYSSFGDKYEDVVPLVVRAVSQCRKLARVVVVTPGVRTLQQYPKADDIGTVFMPNGAGLGPWGFNGNNPILYYGKCPYLAACKGSRPNSVSATNWNRRKHPEHPCEKPEEWMKWMVIRATAFEGETVLDPFTGSGTTGVACIKTGRKFVGIELDAGYCEIAARRMREAENTLFAGAATT